MRYTLLTALLLLSACGQALQNGSGPIALTVDPPTVAAGDSVTLILRNDSPEPVGYNLCSGTLEVSFEGAWQRVPSDRICTMEIRILAPGEVTRYPLALEPGLAPGDYRYVTSVDAMEEGHRGPLRSATFRVVR